MKIKQIQLQGFKSFVDKTVLTFESPISGIVGPNGCGKSNVVDAVRWVLGEQSSRHLRGQSMEDVIFAGSDTRSPLGMASVTLTLSNEDGSAPPDFASYSEITVTRRLYRTGESEYLLNKTVCRLRDIVDLFLGTGAGHKAYSIIEQGRVDFIVQAKPEERRSLIEEAAGVSKFRIRRQEALRRIEMTEVNLSRLADMVGEVKRQLNILERQAQKAERYRVARAELKDIEMKVAATRYQTFRKDCDALEGELAAGEAVEAALKGKTAEGDARQETLRLELAQVERDLSEAQGRAYEAQNQIKLKEAESEYTGKEIESIGQQVERYVVDIVEARRKLEGVTVEAATHLQAYEAAVAAREEKELARRDLTKVVEEKSQRHILLTESMAADNAELQETNVTLSTGSGRLQTLEDRKAHSKGDEASALAARHELQLRLEAVQQSYREAMEKSGEMASTHARRGEEIQEMSAMLAQERETLAGLEEEYHRIKEEIASKKSRLKSLEEMERTLEGYPQGVRTLVSREREKGNPLELVADIVKIPTEYETAVAAALGDRLQSVVVRDHQAGIAAVEYLRNENIGRSTFIPREPKFHERPVPEQIPLGAMGPLANHVQVSQGYELVGHYLFADYLLVKDLRTALDLWASNGHQKTLVTLDGEMVDPHGAISGGVPANVTREILTKKRQIAELQVGIKELSDDLQYKDEEVSAHTTRTAALELSCGNVKKERGDGEIRLLSAEKDIERMRSDILELERKIAELEQDQSQAASELKIVDGELVILTERQQVLAARQTLLEETHAVQRAEEQVLRVELNGLSQNLTELKIAMATLEEKVTGRERDKIRFEGQERELQGLIETRKLEITESNGRIIRLKEAMAALEVERAAVFASSHANQETLQEQSRRFEELKEALGSLEGELKDGRGRLAELSEEVRGVSIKKAELTGQLTALRDQILDKYSSDLAQCYEELAIPGGPVQDWESRGGELRAQLEKIGDVHLGAPEEYAEVKGRFETLNGQYTDLASALEGLRQAISRINRASKKRLSETFELINERFQAIYPKLFNGGRARLVLTDENNLLESGVEIIAQPPGKKLQSVSLLSGGEKALTAIALIFAMFLVRPSPFCFLDEVDAPLDDVNIDRFNEMIREMSAKTQFIIVTHNKRSMENADILYGVTMQEPGVSKIIAVKLSAETQAVAS